MAEGNGYTGNGHADPAGHGNGHGNGHFGAGEFDTDPDETEQLRQQYRDSQKNKRPTSPLWETTQLSTWADRDIPDREWIMEDWIPRGQTTGLYGVSGVLKTTWLLQLMLCASSGLSFCGLPLTPTTCLGLFCEDTRDEILRRARRIAKHYNHGLDYFPNFHFASLVGQMDSELLMFDAGKREVGPAFHQFSQEIEQYRPGLVVLDTLPDFFGGSEVDRRQTSQFIRMLDGLGMTHNCALVCAAHPSVRGRASRRLDSGNSSIEGKMRARLTIHDPGDETNDDEDESGEERAFRIATNPTDRRILTRVNSNYAKPGETIPLIVRDGIFVPEAIDPETAKLRGPYRAQAVKTLFLELLAQLKKEGRYVNNTPTHPEFYAPRAFAPHPLNKKLGANKKEFEKAMIELLAPEKSDWKGSGRPVNRIANWWSAVSPKPNPLGVRALCFFRSVGVHS